MLPLLLIAFEEDFEWENLVEKEEFCTHSHQKKKLHGKECNTWGF